MNKMADFAKLLGKELDEEFIVKAEEDFKCKMTNRGLFVYSSVARCWVEQNNLLYDLISGKYKIKKTPWRAKKLEVYYVPDPAMGEMYRKTKNVICNEDNVSYIRGLMCKTPEQAIEIAKAMIKLAREMQGLDY
ncbi:MAG: hypothetical protein J6O04_09680 [Selenomonadaceae bacterium]|nr:hypothetical protein [Selenomonadaceae bacterium]